MLQKREALNLLQDVLKVFGNPTLNTLRRGGHLPRPPLFSEHTRWRDYDLQSALLPRTRRPLSGVEIHEVFAAFVEVYILDKDNATHPYAYLKNVLQIDRRDHQNLFPNHRGISDEVITCAIAVILYVAFANGHQVLYGKDWALALCDDYVIGIDQGMVVCSYEACCVPFPEVDWRDIFEAPRQGSYLEYGELYNLYGRSRSDAYRNQDIYAHIILTLLWAARSHLDVLRAATYFEDADCGLEEYILDRIQKGARPIETLRSILVPAFTSARNYNSLIEPHRLTEPFWSTEETDDFVHNVLRRFGITKNNKKGKPHANRTKRKGSLR